MRNKGFLSFFLLLSVLISCSTEEETLPDINTTKEYSGSSLTLLYSGQLMPAKKVIFEPGNDKNLSSGMLICSGITDLSQISGLGLSGEGAAPGILPGNPLLNIPIELKSEKGAYHFSGKSNADYIDTYSFSGFLKGDSCHLEIFDVLLDNQSLGATVWKPATSDTSQKQPFHLVWELDPASNIDIDLSKILELLVKIPIIPVDHDQAFSSLEQVYSSSLQTVAFKENGNIILRYYSSVGGAVQLFTSTGNTLQYVIPSSNNLLLYPNPTTLFGRWLVWQSDPGDNPDISFRSGDKDNNSDIQEILLPLIKGILPKILDLTSTGIPLTYQIVDGMLSVYISTPVLLNIMGEILEVIESNPEILNALLANIADKEEIMDLFGELEKLLPQLKEILLKTTRLEIGFNYTSVQNNK